MTESQEIKNARKDEISLKDVILKLKEWWRYFWAKKWIIIAAGILGGILGLVYAINNKTIYTATTTFVLENGEKSGGGLGAYAGLASMVGIDIGAGGGGIFQGDNILELYKSRKMIEKALLSNIDTNSKETLVDRYININGLKEEWKDRPDLSSISFKSSTPLDSKHLRLRDSIMGVIINAISKNALSVGKPDKKLSIIKVDVSSNDEIFSKRFNEELVKNVNDFYVQTKTKKSLENITILQHKTDSVKAAMNGAIYNSVAVADATPNANPTRQVQRAAPIQRAQFSAETNKAILGELVKNLEMSKMALLRESPLIQVVDGPKYPLNTERFGKAKGVVFGGFLFGFIALFLLILKKIYKDIING